MTNGEPAQFRYRTIPILGWLRLLRFTCAALAGFAVYLFPHLLSKRRTTRFAAAFLRLLARASGLEVVVTGSALLPRSLIVANHISWADILVLGSLVPMRFVAKAEVANWPVLGFLASLSGSLFIDRTRRQDVGSQVQQMQDALESDRLMLFPEGTTGDAMDVLPFRPALFAAAVIDQIVQPVTLCYDSRSGHPVWTVDMRRNFAWDGDKPFVRHAVAIIAAGGARCRVHVHDAIVASGDRKILASTCHAIIRQSFLRTPQ